MLSKLKPSSWLLLIIALCIIVRLAVLLALPGVFAFEQTGIVHGNEAHDSHAKNLVSEGIFGRLPGVPDADFPPLYVYLVAGIYGTLGRGHLQIGLFQTLLDVISVVLLYQIGKRLFRRSSEQVGLLAAFFYAMYPYLIFQNLTLVETPLFITELNGLVLIMILLRERTVWDRVTWALIALGGLVLGLGLLTRPIIMPLMAFVGVWFLFKRSFMQTILRLVPVVVLSILLAVPWIVRNYQALNALVLISTNGGENFWFGNSPYTIPFLRAGYHPSFMPISGLIEGLTRPQMSAHLFDLGFQYIRQHPDQIPDLLWAKFLAYWSLDVFPRLNPSSGANPIPNYQGFTRVENDAQGNLVVDGVPVGDAVTAYSDPLFDKIGRVVHRLYFGGLLLLALIGVGLTIHEWRDVSLLWFVQICMTLVYIIFNPATRYRAPTDGMLFLFSAYTLVVLWEAVQKRRQVVRVSAATT